jgi:hypothetical protein
VQSDPVEAAPELPPTRSGRKRFANKCHKDLLPAASSRVVPAAQPALLSVESTLATSAPEPDDTDIPMLDDASNSGVYRTEPNEFGIFREYPHRPLHDPDRVVPLQNVCDAPGFPGSAPPPVVRNWYSGITRSLIHMLPENILDPLSSFAVFRLLLWSYRHPKTSNAAMDDLVHNVILRPDFNRDDPDMINFSANRELHKLDRPDAFSVEDGWQSGPVKIPVPFTGLKAADRTDEHTYTSGIVYWRSIMEVINASLAEMDMNVFHTTPFKAFWMGPDEVEPVYSEIYTSEAMINEYNDIRLRLQHTTQLQIVVIALMFWSDSTHLAQFGNASLWPIYMYFGNISKYIRSKLSSFSAHHMAYLPKVHHHCLANVHSY